jgi:CRISPR-associated protein Csm3
MRRDFEILKEGFRLLEYDYLGGHGSRGYGKVKISNLDVAVVVGDISQETVDFCQNLMDEIE